MRELNADEVIEYRKSTGCNLNEKISVCNSGYGNLKSPNECSSCNQPFGENTECKCFVRPSAVNDTKNCEDIDEIYERYKVDQFCGKIDSDGNFKKCDPGCCVPNCAGECCQGLPQPNTNFSFVPDMQYIDDKEDSKEEDEEDEEYNFDKVKKFIPKNVFNFLMFLMTYALIVILILLALK